MATETENEIKPKVKLIGQDGNAFRILGLCRKAALKAGWSKDQWNKFHGKATAGDYDHLLRLVMARFEVG